jgi:guanylate kinase
MESKIIILSAPSGSGKTTIAQQILEDNDLNCSFSVSATSRQPRQHEVHGKHYYFLNPQTFREYIQLGKFVEWEEVYPSQYYGTLHSEIDTLKAQGKNILFDVDVKGGVRLKSVFGENALSVFIMPPSVTELENRLKNRQTENEESLKKRILRAKEELSFANRFDFVVVNDDLMKAVSDVKNHIADFLNMKNEKKKSEKIALFFGSFNPVHQGHIHIAQHILQFGLSDEVWFVLSPQSPFKLKENLIEETHRLNMLNLAIEGHFGMRSCDIELHLPQPSYTINTLNEISQRFPETTFSIIMGMDNIIPFKKWKSWEQILNNHQLLVYPRKRYSLPQWQHHNIVIMEHAPLFDVSASRFRKDFLRHKDAQKMLPEKVMNYILKHNLYQDRSHN